MDSLAWSATERRHGKRIKRKGGPKDHQVQVFRVVASSRRTDWIGTHDPTADTREAAQAAGDVRWKSEQLHRAGNHVSGLERCHCRTARIQRKHIGGACLVWVRRKNRAAQPGRTIYQLKHGLLDDYLTQQLKRPSLKMVLA